MNHLKPYPAYKDSGVPWLGDVPEHWDMNRGKWLFEKMVRPYQENDDVVTCFRDGMVTLRKNRRVRGFTESLKEIGYQGIRKGDLIIHAMDAFAGAIGVSDSDGKGTPVYQVLKPTEKSNAYYYAYIIREMARSQWILALAKGIRERSTDFRYGDFASQLLPIPPLLEQNAITRYLNYMGRRIRRYLNAKKKLIALLNEQKQAIIHRVVTRGLDPNVRLKPSGVEWLEDNPEHWEVRRLKYSAQLIMGQSPSSDDYNLEKTGLPFLQGCAEFGITSPNAKYFCRSPAKVSPKDAILMSVRAPVGRLNVADQKYGIGRGLCAIFPRLSILDMNFSLYELGVFIQGLFRVATGSTYDAVSIGDVGSLSILLPPIPEQTAIIQFLNGATANINAAINRAHHEIDFLREYRTRLVADVVTGKMDVREAAANLPEEVEEELAAFEKVESLSDNGAAVEDDEEALIGVTDEN